MANIKFSQFTIETAKADVDFLVGYSGPDNVQISTTNLLADYPTGSGAAGQVAFFDSASSITGDNDLYWDSTNERLGIGTASPGHKLTIKAVSSSQFEIINSINNKSWRPVVNGSDFYITETGVGNPFVVKAGGNVGIGTTSPSAKLEVDGTLIATGISQLGSGGSNVLLTSSSAGNVGIGTSSPGSKLHIDEAGTSFPALFIDTARYGASIIGDGTSNSQYLLNLQSNGGSTDVMRVQSSGNVGIGTNSPAEKLDISSGGIRLDDNQRITWSTNDSNIGRVRITGNESNDFITFVTDNSERMRINGANVGIGTNNPIEKLQINSGDVLINNSTLSTLKSGGSLYIDLNTFGSYSGRNFRILNNGTSLVNLTQAGNFGIGTTSPGAPLDVVGLIRTTTSFVGNACIVNNLTSATSGGSIFFKNNSGVDLATLADNGNVGIGTTTPDTILEVVNDVDNSSSPATDVNAGIIIHNGDSSGTAVLKLRGSGGDSGAVVFGGGGGAASDKFHIISRHNQTKRFTVQANGNVGIGTSSPTAKLTVDSGDVEVTLNTKGIILKSPDGTRYRITVANGGSLTSTALP